MVKWLKLKECCEILDSKRIPITAAKRKKGPYPYYGANGVQDYIDDYIFDDELVLLAEDGGNFGSREKPIAYRISGKCWVNNHAHVLKPKKGLNVDYLCYSLAFYNVDKLINGATRKKLTQGAVKDMEIPVVSLATQHKIVSQIKKVQSIKKLRQQQLNKLNKLIKARFVEMFGDPNIGEEVQKKVSMTDICQIIDGDRGRNYPHANDFYNEGYCLFLNAKNVTDNGFNFSNKMYISKEKDETLKKGKLNRGDLVLTTRGTIGNLAFYSSNIPFDNIRINSGMVILRLNHDKVKETFFIEQFKLQLRRIKQKIASGTAQPQLPISTMNKIKMFLPPLSLQNEFANFVQQVDKSKFENIVYLNKTLSSKILSQLGDAIRD